MELLKNAMLLNKVQKRKAISKKYALRRVINDTPQAITKKGIMRKRLEKVKELKGSKATKDKIDTMPKAKIGQSFEDNLSQ